MAPVCIIFSTIGKSCLFFGSHEARLGLEQAGLIPLLASEIDDAAKEKVLTNRHDIGLIGDIRNYPNEEIFLMAGLASEAEIDVLVGSPSVKLLARSGNDAVLTTIAGIFFYTTSNLYVKLGQKLQ